MSAARATSRGSKPVRSFIGDAQEVSEVEGLQKGREYPGRYREVEYQKPTPAEQLAMYRLHDQAMRELEQASAQARALQPSQPQLEIEL